MRIKKFLPIFRVAFLILVSLVVGLKIYAWNARSLTGNVLPMPFGYGAAVVLTGSMEPTIMTDELIIVQAQEDYEVGDVVVYQTGKILVVHRIIAMDAETVTTQGDANNVADAPVDLAHIKGRVIRHIPNVGTAVRILKTPWATVLLIGGALLTAELPYRKKKNEDMEQRQKLLEEIRKLKDEL